MARLFTFDSSARRGDADPRRLAGEFWPKVSRVAASIPFAEDAVATYYCAFDRDTPVQVRVSLVAALAYFVLPVDVVPDLLPALGFTDDAAVLFGTLKLVGSHVTALHRAAARAALDRLTGGAIPDVEPT